MKNALYCVLGLVVVGVSMPLTHSPAAAADPMMKMDCANASAMMMHAVKIDAKTPLTGDVDADFRTMAMLHEKGASALMKIETGCGKDPKMKAAAAKAMEQSNELTEMFRDERP